MGKIRTFYDELGVEPDARSPEIKHAFREIARRYHPDVNPADKQEWAHEQMSRLNFIVDTLLDDDARKEYDGLVAEHERGQVLKPRRTRRQADALHKEFARVSVEIMNLSGKYSNCRLKILIGSVAATVSILMVVLGTALSVQDIYLNFLGFPGLVGLIVAGMGVSDFVGRNRYRKRIQELESRQSVLRRRMYESTTMYSTY